VNDAGGHAAGDSLLVNLATALKVKLRPYDVIIRFGGDEFVCGLAGLGLAGASERMQLVHAAFAESSEIGSITVGLAELGPEESLESLIGRADSALYRQRQLQRPNEQP
jgi:diguanylate cyclase (GGDEF)-like protein